MAFAEGGGNAAIAIRQPMQQQQSAQFLPVPVSSDEVSSAASVWQMAPPGIAPAGAAARATPKLPSTVESPIT